MLIVAKNMSEINRLKAQLNGYFEMKDLEATKNILGIEIYRDKKAKKLYLSQKNYFIKVLEHFRMQDSKLVSNPLTNHFKLSTNLSPQTEERKHMSQVIYVSAVKSLLYSMVGTHPDILHTVSIVSIYMENLGKAH